MMVRDVMTTQLMTVAPDDSLCHVSNLLRQHRFHHLPVVRADYRVEIQQVYRVQSAALLFEGIITSQNVELAIEHAKEVTTNGASCKVFGTNHSARIFSGIQDGRPLLNRADTRSEARRTGV